MPTVKLFAPCMRAIISQEDNSVSLISLLQGVRIPVPQGAEVPANAVAPFTWDVVTIWHTLPDDPRDRPFEQRVRVLSPSGDELVSVCQSFTLNESEVRNISHVEEMPIGR